MPIPKYNGEDEKDYISECMKAIGSEYDQDQALAICYKQMDMKETKFAADANKHASLPEKPHDHDVHHGATSDKAAKAVKPKGIAANENEKNKKQTMSAFDRKRLEFQINQALTELRTNGINLAEEGGGSYPWDECIADQTAKYGADSAEKICGYIKSEYGS